MPTADKLQEDRRVDQRIPIGGIGSLQILQPLSLERVAVTVMNTSKNGLGLRVAVQLDAGALVQIRLQDVIVMGRIRHCKKTGEHFSAGVLVEHVHRITDVKRAS